MHARTPLGCDGCGQNPVAEEEAVEHATQATVEARLSLPAKDPWWLWEIGGAGGVEPIDLGWEQTTKRSDKGKHGCRSRTRTFDPLIKSQRMRLPNPIRQTRVCVRRTRDGTLDARRVLPIVSRRSVR